MRLGPPHPAGHFFFDPDQTRQRRDRAAREGFPEGAACRMPAVVNQGRQDRTLPVVQDVHRFGIHQPGGFQGKGSGLVENDVAQPPQLCPESSILHEESRSFQLGQDDFVQQGQGHPQSAGAGNHQDGNDNLEGLGKSGTGNRHAIPPAAAIARMMPRYQRNTLPRSRAVFCSPEAGAETSSSLARREPANIPGISTRPGSAPPGPPPPEPRRPAR